MALAGETVGWLYEDALDSLRGSHVRYFTEWRYPLVTAVLAAAERQVVPPFAVLMELRKLVATDDECTEDLTEAVTSLRGVAPK